MNAYEKSLEIYEKQKDESGSMEALGSIADIYGKWGQYDKQIKISERVLDFHTKQGDTAGIISDYLSIGDVYSKWTKFDVANNYFKKALELSKEIKSFKQTYKQLILSQLGYNYLEWGKIKKASTIFYDSLKIAQE